MTRLRFYTGLLSAVLGMCANALIADDGPLFNTVRVNGQNYINLADFVRYYGFERDWKQDGLDVNLKAKYKKFKFRINSRECSLNGVRLWLNDSPFEDKNSILISEVDIKKTLDPILRPWSIPRQKVRTIMIDPGHGGVDYGTIGYRGSQEKKLTLDLAARVDKLLRQAGFKTMLTRRTDTYVSPEERPQFANSSEADIFVSIHFNSVPKPNIEAKGLETYCVTPVGLAPTGSIRKRLGFRDYGAEPGNLFDRQNMLLAYLVHQKMLKTIPGITDRGVRRARYMVLKATERPSILVESGFLSNPTEENQILTAAYRNKLAEAIVEGIKRYSDMINHPE